MARETMAGLISRLRLLIHDPASPDQTFTDDELQSFLDETRRIVTQEPLIGATDPDGQIRVWRAASAGWEADTALYYAGQEITATTEDPALGVWTFTAGQNGPVYLRGTAYEIYRAAASALRAWAARLKLEYDFSAGGDTWHRRQRMDSLLALAVDMENRSEAGGRSASVLMERSDWI